MEALDEGPSVVVDNSLRVVSSFRKVDVLQLTATSATEGKPNHHVAAEAERSYHVQYHLERAAKKNVMSHGYADAEATWRVVCQLPQRGRLTTANLNKEARVEGRDEAKKTKSILHRWVVPGRVCASQSGKTEVANELPILG